jgi:hypothetical protein
MNKNIPLTEKMRPKWGKKPNYDENLILEKNS